jgi:hypothetical protein
MRKGPGSVYDKWNIVAVNKEATEPGVPLG